MAGSAATNEMYCSGQSAPGHDGRFDDDKASAPIRASDTPKAVDQSVFTEDQARDVWPEHEGDKMPTAVWLNECSSDKGGPLPSTTPDLHAKPNGITDA